MKPTRLFAIAAILTIAACDESNVSTADVADAAKERVRQSLGLADEAALFTNVFTGEPLDGEPVLCGTVEGRRSDGTAVPPRRFIAALDPARWVKFEPSGELDAASPGDKFVEWHTACAGEESVR